VGSPVPTFINLVRTSAADSGEGFGEVVGLGFGGGECLSSGLDRDCAVAACGSHEFLDAPTCLVVNPVRYGQCSEHDRQVCLNGLAGVVVDRAGPQVVLGHAEAALDAP
jgi:hypothetical protein